MNILKQNKLNESQIHEITELAKTCGNYDAYFEMNPPTHKDCFFLCYEENLDGKLLGFLSFLSIESSSFLPSDSNDDIFQTEAEITAMTLPSARRQGIFSKLYHAALKELFSQGITDVYCAVPENQRASSLTDTYSHSEYLELLTIENTLHYPQKSLCRQKNHFVLKRETDTHRHTIMYQNGIGSCRLFEEDNFTNLCGLLIKKPYRGNGYGYEFLAHVIQDYYSFNSKPLVLNVSSRNKPACRLYEKLDFKIIEEVKYYRLKNPF